MKRILFCLLSFFIACNSFGQSVEWEIANIGYAFGFQKDKNEHVVASGSELKSEGALSLGTEVRYNYAEKRLSSGIQFSFSGWNRYASNGDLAIHQNPFTFLVVNDYNFLNIHPQIVPFAGAGLGYSITRTWSHSSKYESEDGNKSHFAFSPRIGAEFFKRVRLSAEYQYIGNKNSFFNIKLGFVIGS
jgi:opacity protein-like surface antigen